MEWQDWLEKTEPTGLTPKQRKLAKEIADGDKDDHTQYYTKASWETWLEKNDPCWEGYEQYGMKDKDGKKVPNCVKKADESKPLNKPMRDDGNKKFKVFVRDPSTGNIVTVRFGDPNMEIKRDNPERRSSFRARHKCSEQKDITSAAYWSCKMWEKTSSVSDNVNKSNWEIWLEKNNAIETSHKEGEKKEEWNGKFDNSTTRDGVKDDKAQDEEEPLEELTDGKLEEVEKLKSWELWLEKDALDDKQSKVGLPKATEDIMNEAQETIDRDKRGKLNPMYKSWESWLEKMQGAGDARYGNQHLTGMEQKPVDDDESIDLSAESDKNNEKQEKTEDKEGKDNKPYKALS